MNENTTSVRVEKPVMGDGDGVYIKIRENGLYVEFSCTDEEAKEIARQVLKIYET